jgi:hypothetical protein
MGRMWRRSKTAFQGDLSFEDAQSALLLAIMATIRGAM